MVPRPLALLLVLLTAPLLARSNARLPYTLDTFTTRDGLVDNRVTALYEEHNGLLYVGTYDGLCTFDGRRFDDLSQEPDLPHEPIIALQDSPHGLLCLSSSQLMLRRNGHFTVLYQQKHADFAHLFQTPGGHVWITARELLLRAGPDLVFKPVPRQGLPLESVVQALVELGDGTLLAALTHRGLFRFDKAQQSWTSLNSELPHLEVNVLLPSKSGLWIGTHGGVCRYRNGHIEPAPFAAALPGPIVRVLVESDGLLWIAGPHQGVLRWDGKQLHRYDQTDGLPSRSIYGIYADRAGTLWFRSNNGLAIFRNGRITPIGVAEGLSSPFVIDVHAGASGLVWVGTYRGLTRIQNKRLDTLYTPANNPIESTFKRIYSQDEDRLFFPTHDGLGEFRKGEFRLLTLADGLPANAVTRIACLPAKRVWVGTDNGPAYLDRNRFLRPAYPDVAMPTARIELDARNWVWILDQGHHLWRNQDPDRPRDGFRPAQLERQALDFHVTDRGYWLKTPDQFLFFDLEDKLLASVPTPTVKVYLEAFLPALGAYVLGTDEGLFKVAIQGLEDLGVPLGPEEKPVKLLEAGERLYLVTAPFRSLRGYRAEGLWVREKGVWRRSNLANPDLTQAVVKHGTTWLLTTTGLARQTEDGEITYFTRRQGLAGSQPTKVLRGDGNNLWIAANGGITKYDGDLAATLPHSGSLDEAVDDLERDGQGSLWIRAGGAIQRYREGVTGPSVQLEALLLDGEALSLDRPIVLPYNNNLTVRYRAINLRGGDDLQFTWKIQGENHGYVGQTREESLSLPGLPPDRYQLTLKAYNSDLVSSDQNLTVIFQVLAPFWLRGLNPLYLALACLTLIYLIYRLRLRHKLEQLRLVNELAVAHNVQQALMPDRPPLLEGYEIAGTCAPAQEVGGDYFDIFWTEPEQCQLAVTVMDVSGKSMQGAIISVLSSGLLYGHSGRGQGPAEVLSGINGHLYAKTDKKTFITGILALLEPVSGQLALANAGHVDPILIRDGAAQTLARTAKRDLALGAVKRWNYGEIALELLPGDLLCLYTDGLNEAQNAQHQLFGEAALIAALVRQRELPVKELLQRILDEIARFRGKTPQSDDITLVVIKRLPALRESD